MTTSIKPEAPLAAPFLQQCEQPWGKMSWRESGSGACVLLLHGISSGSAAWAKQFNNLTLTSKQNLLAWDAPGYGESSALAQSQPLATEYVARLTQWLTAINVVPKLVVGHSLGALIAAAYAATRPMGLQGMILANPAVGYGTESVERRQQIYQQRSQQLNELGAVGYAEARAQHLLRPDAAIADVMQVKYSMNRLHKGGFAQASWMLANDDIHRYLPQVTVMTEIWCGELDGITPPQGAQNLAKRYDWPFYLLPQAGHASYLDADTQFNQRLAGVLDNIEEMTE